MAHTPGVINTPGTIVTTPGSVPPSNQPAQEPTPKGPSKHLQYATHFPIPQEEYCNHECNQRMVVLYGVGKARDESRHVFKKATKELQRLFSKKNCIDIVSGELGKKQKKKEKDREKEKDVDSSTNLEMIYTKFQKLSYYDQHAATWTCANAILEQFQSFSSGSSQYLPVVENIAFLFDLMENALNINGMISFAVQVCSVPVIF